MFYFLLLDGNICFCSPDLLRFAQILDSTLLQLGKVLDVMWVVSFRRFENSHLGGYVLGYLSAEYGTVIQRL